MSNGSIGCFNLIKSAQSMVNVDYSAQAETVIHDSLFS